MAQPTTNFGNRSVSSMAAKVYAFIKRKSSDPISGLQTTYINDYIATADAYFCDYAKWTFRRTSKVLDHYSATSLGAALATSDANITVADNTNAASGGGRIVIGRDEIDYESKSGSTILVKSTATGAKGVDVSHASGAEVTLLVPVPSDFGKPGELWHGDSVDPARSKLKHLDYRAGRHPPLGCYFVNDGYIYRPRGLPTGRLYLVYYKKAQKPTSSDDIQTPEKYDNFVLWYSIAMCYQVIGNEAKAEYYFGKAGFPTVSNPEPVGILQLAAANDAEQTDSLDEVFTPDL